MIETARIALVSLVCIFALACGSKEDKPAPKEAPTPAEKVVPAAKAPTAAQPVTGLAADPNAEAPAEGATAETVSALVTDLQKLADKACACKDAACAGGIQDEVAKLMSEAKEPSKTDAQAIANAMQKMQGCVAAAQQK